MIYSTELANNTPDFVSKYLEAGIQENVKLVSAKADKSVNGRSFLEIKFERDGKELTHTEWENTKFPNQSDEDYQNRCTWQVKRMLQILECFYPKAALTFVGSTYEEFTKWVASLLNSANKDILLRVKIVYNKNGYTCLSTYGTFIEPMTVEKSNIVQMNKDVFVRPVIADKEVKEINPLDSDAEETTGDLPF